MRCKPPRRLTGACLQKLRDGDHGFSSNELEELHPLLGSYGSEIETLPQTFGSGITRPELPTLFGGWLLEASVLAGEVRPLLSKRFLRGVCTSQACRALEHSEGDGKEFSVDERGV